MRRTGLPWVPEVPEDWELVPNKALIRRRKVLVGDRHEDLTLLSLTKQGIIIRDVESGRGKFSSDMGTCQEVRSGDLVFCLFDVPETPRTVGLSRHEGMITGAYTVFECLDPQVATFFELFYRAMDDRKLLSPLYSGLRNTIPRERFLSIKTPLPPQRTRDAIVGFVAAVEAQVRYLIRSRTVLMRLGQEGARAATQRELLGGEFKSQRATGVEWISNIPEHWEVLRCRYLFQEIDDRSLEGLEQPLSMSQRLGIVPSDEVEGRTLVAASLVGGKLCKEGDLVLNRLKAHLGVFALSPYAGVVSPDYTVLRPRVEGDPRYFEQLLRSHACRSELRVRSKGVVEGFWRLYTDDFYDIKVPVPPIEERSAIATKCEQINTRAGEAMDRCSREIALLREYQIRVCSDAVTGSIDVESEPWPDAPSDSQLSELRRLEQRLDPTPVVEAVTSDEVVS